MTSRPLTNWTAGVAHRFAATLAIALATVGRNTRLGSLLPLGTIMRYTMVLLGAARLASRDAMSPVLRREGVAWA